jgi:alanyl-tRNA synthetase
MIPLPAPSIDTGMGLERIVSVIQDKRSNYDTDLFATILAAAAERAGTVYGADPEQDFSLRVIADHARAFSFLVADGVVPANDKRGYVLRRLLRRAIRHGRKLGIGEPFLHEVTPVVCEMLGGVYPELLAARDAVLEIGRREEQRFAETLTTGLALLESKLGELDEPDGVLPGRELFRLYDTFGFPLDLARDIAEEKGIRLDEAGFETEMAKQRARAQAAWRGSGSREVDDAYRELAGRVVSRFEGYDRTELDGVELLALTRNGRPVEELGEGQEGELVLEATPFYAEAGGQVGDRGMLVGPAGGAAVLDTQRPAEGLIVHRARVESGRLAAGERLRAEVDAGRRDSIRRNHTATHLLHAALREVVGPHVKQAGSLVAPDRLRFDFSHFAGLSDEALADIESLVNGKVLEDLPIETSVVDLDEALKGGAMALFGEKYDDRVRTVRVGDFSYELCGGTHCARTGEIGLVKLTQERGIASGTRRVEAISGEGSLRRFRDDHDLVRALEERLSVPGSELMAEIDRRTEQIRELQRALGQQKLRRIREGMLQGELKTQVVCGVKVIAERADGLAAQELRELADALRGRLGSGLLVLGRADGPKASLLVAVTPDLTRRVPAGELVRRLGKIIGGGGGGRPDMAEAGGREPQRLDEALRAASDAVRDKMEEASSSG